MFDVFDIQIPSLSARARVEVRRRETAFGLEDDGTAYVDGVELGRFLRDEEASSYLRAWIGSADRSTWTVLNVAHAACNAADDDGRWPQFLAALVSLLRAHDVWVVRCESDCDQGPLERLALSAEQLGRLLDDARTERGGVSFVVTPS